MNKKDLCVSVDRLLLEKFQYMIEHRSDKSMMYVDALNRNPLPICLIIDEGEVGLTARLRKARKARKRDSEEKIGRDVMKSVRRIMRDGLLYEGLL